MPLLAPVTITTLPASSPVALGLIVGCSAV
jgi:hypothetical protein